MQVILGFSYKVLLIDVFSLLYFFRRLLWPHEKLGIARLSFCVNRVVQKKFACQWNIFTRPPLVIPAREHERVCQKLCERTIAVKMVKTEWVYCVGTLQRLNSKSANYANAWAVAFSLAHGASKYIHTHSYTNSTLNGTDVLYPTNARCCYCYCLRH